MLPSKVSAALNQGLVEDHMSFCAQISPLSYPSFPPHGIDQQTTGGLNMDRGFASNLREVLPSMLPGYRAAPSDDDGFGQLGASSEQRSSNNLWSWSELEGDLGDKRSIAAEDYHNKKNNNSSSNNNIHRLSVGAIRMKKVKTRKNVREPRFCFKTLSEVDVLDDGYKWRKYGRKVVKNTQHPRYTLKKKSRLHSLRAFFSSFFSYCSLNPVSAIYLNPFFFLNDLHGNDGRIHRLFCFRRITFPFSVPRFSRRLKQGSHADIKSFRGTV